MRVRILMIFWLVAFPGHVRAAITVTTTDNEGIGSLRWAITNANARAGMPLIDFSIPPLDGTVKTIFITNALPAITNFMWINGYSQDNARRNTATESNNAVILIEITTTRNESFNGLQVDIGSCIIEGLSIHGFANAISLGGTNGFNYIAGNFIGLDPAGMFPPSRVNQNGIAISSPYNSIGGPDPEERNMISGNVINGILISGVRANTNFILGNHIGPAREDFLPGIPNGTGISLSGRRNYIGGPEPGSGNVISGNQGPGLVIGGEYTLVQNNLIGTMASGYFAMGNAGFGVTVSGHFNQIGVADPSGPVPDAPGRPAGNVISGNRDGGVRIINGGSNNTVVLNVIGSDATGSYAIPNRGIGVLVFQGNDTSIGGFYGSSIGNLISGNEASGISVGGGGIIDRTTIAGNMIGIQRYRYPVPNLIHGVFLGSDARNSLILGNTIAYNEGTGIAARGGASATNNLLATEFAPNLIFKNGALGIDLALFNLDGVTTNDNCDVDSGAMNRLQNFPVITLVTNTVDGLRIDGYLNSTPDTDFGLQFFTSDNCDPSGHGEGAKWLGYTYLTTGANCTNVFSVTFPERLRGCAFITATATDPAENTSEFSQCYAFGQGSRCMFFLPLGLTNWWTGDNTTTNWIEGGSSVGLSNGTMFATGKVDMAFSFDGINDFASVPDSPSLRPASFTLEAWVNFANVSGVNRKSLMSKPVGTGFNNSYGMFLQNGVLGGIVGNASSVSTLLTSFAPATGVWYHVAYTYDRSATNHALYVNGVLQRKATTTATNGYDNRDFMMGADRNAGTLQEFFAGLLDEPTIYDRVLLSEELQDIFCAGAFGKCREPCSTNDTEAPQITCPANVTVNALPGDCNRVVNFPDPPVTDNCPSAAVACNPPSGTAFPKGTTLVNCTASDTAGNTTPCSFAVTVYDDESPRITCPANIIVDTAPGACTRIVNFPDPIVTDNCPNPLWVCDPPSGTPFDRGVTLVTCTVTDIGGNIDTCSFNVTVNDPEAPTLTCPDDVTVNTDAGECSKNVNYPPPAVFDNCPGVSAVCTPLSGSLFPLGTNTVLCQATDFSGNTSIPCAFKVIVHDRESPTIICPADISVDAAPGQPDAIVNYPAPLVSDNCTNVTADCLPPSGARFPVGINSIVCTATDTSGNAVSCQFRVTVSNGLIFRDIRLEGSGIRLSWQTPAGTTNRVQVAPSLTNPFVDLSSNIFIPGIGVVNTNYLDAGGATGGPARFYRLRLAP